MNIDTRSPRCPHCLEVQIGGMPELARHLRWDCAKLVGRSRYVQPADDPTPAREMQNA